MIARLRWPTLGAVVVVAGTISVVGLRWWTTRGNLAPDVPLLLTGVLFALAALVLVLGLRVRRAVVRARLDDPVGAARILALGQAAAITAAIHVGYLLAQLALAVPRLSAPEPRELALRSALALVGALALGAAGMITQWCCRTPDDEDEDPTPGFGNAST
ncbi:DUF3180 domain-containing protein [Ruania suaedae]|uniref:DUF3180 family protein n=1 Tax=Ruania suaedae TaxID=2897774 RepID=UPI001E370264|nr:DUF3180 family protein [Ruania suaedae]UFU03508.1 DUF3180 domain-containing protein [Ruania suaedae]